MSMPRIEVGDGRPTIRLVRQLPYPAERVWRAVTAPDELQRWFVAPVQWTPGPGEEFEIFGLPGRVTEVDAPRVLAWEWGEESFRFEIEPSDEGCVLTFLHVFSTAFGQGEERAAGWDVYFGRLDTHLAGAFVDEESASRQGVQAEEGGRPAVRFHRRLEHPIDRVWRAVTEPAELSRWFPDVPQTGQVHTLDPPHRFEFSWGDDLVRIELVDLEQGTATQLTFTHVLSDDESALSRTAAGWQVCLDGLERIVVGELDQVEHGRSAAWDTAYQAYVDRGFPAGAPIPAE